MLNNANGFVSKPQAIRKVVTNPDGTTGIIYVDAKTNKEVSNPTGYHIVEAKSTPMGYNFNAGTGNNNAPDKPTLTDIASGEQNRGERASEQAVKDANKSSQTLSQGIGDIGYINKPAGIGLLGFLPGVGTAVSLGSMGVNAHNTGLVNDQREVLGFSPKSTLSDVGSTLTDKHGYIGDQAYNDGAGNTHVTPVSFEAQDKIGRTTLTPDEARMREQLNPTAQEATIAQAQNAQTKYDQEHPSTGFFGGILSASKNLMGNIFGGSPSTPATPGTGASGGTSKSLGEFPDAPKAPEQTPNSSGSPDDRDSTSNPNVPDGPGLY